MAKGFNNKRSVVSTPVEFFKKVSIYKKGLLDEVSNKAELLLGEIKEVSEGTPEIDYSKSFSEVFKLNLKYKIMSLLNKDIIIKKLIDFTDKSYLFCFCRDLITFSYFKKYITWLFITGINIYCYNNNTNYYICIFMLILSLICGFSTGVLYHSYRELPNNICFNKKTIFGSMSVSVGFWSISALILLNVISLRFLISFILAYLFVFLVIVIISSIIATIHNKMGYLLR